MSSISEVMACVLDDKGAWHDLYYYYSYTDIGAANVKVWHGCKQFKFTTYLDGEFDEEEGERLAYLYYDDFYSFFSSTPTENIRVAIRNAELEGLNIMKILLISICERYCFDVSFSEFSKDGNTNYEFDMLKASRNMYNTSIDDFGKLFIEKGPDGFAEYINEVD